jgi:colicin import membrane protein
MAEAKAKLQAEANMAAARAQQASENQRMLGMLENTIRTQVSERWVPVSSSALTCIIQIRLGPQGQLLGAPVIVKSSGDAHFDHLVIAAVEAAAPFVPPIGLPYSAFNTPINLKMNAEDLNHG